MGQVTTLRFAVQICEKRSTGCFAPRIVTASRRRLLRRDDDCTWRTAVSD